jgi:hypothetical protein
VYRHPDLVAEPHVVLSALRSSNGMTFPVV